MEQNTHTLNVFATKLGIALMQKSITEKTNEIGAINEILDEADLGRATVSIDTIGCQVEIRDKIIAKGGDYMLALKANQGSSLSDVESIFNAKNTYNPDVFEEYDKDHGRIEIRNCELIQNTKGLQEQHKNWRDLNSVAKITSARIIKEK